MLLGNDSGGECTKRQIPALNSLEIGFPTPASIFEPFHGAESKNRQNMNKYKKIQSHQ